MRHLARRPRDRPVRHPEQYATKRPTLQAVRDEQERGLDLPCLRRRAGTSVTGVGAAAPHHSSRTSSVAASVTIAGPRPITTSLGFRLQPRPKSNSRIRCGYPAHFRSAPDSVARGCTFVRQIDDKDLGNPLADIAPPAYRPFGSALPSHGRGDRSDDYSQIRTARTFTARHADPISNDFIHPTLIAASEAQSSLRERLGSSP